jgi:pimeloyl-ACP methyl ester carboxylesterase
MTWLEILALLLLVASIWLYILYEGKLRASRQRLRGVSRVAETPCGPIEYAEAGSGAPVLLVHGAGGGFDQGLELGGPLAERGFEVVAMSRFGYLRTPLPADASPAAQADAHACLMDALGIARAAVFAGSAGAPSALQFASRYPERCLALVLLVPIAYKPPEVAASAPSPSPLAERVLMTIVGSDFAYWLATTFARGTVIKRVLATPPEVFEAASAEERARVGRFMEHIQPISSRVRGILNDSRVSRSLTPDDLTKVAAPTLLISARDDLYGTFANAEYTAKGISGARFIGFDSGGHVCIGHHDQIIEEITAFLRAHATGDGSA